MSQSFHISINARHQYSKWAGLVGLLLMATVIYDLLTIGIRKEVDGSFNWRIGFNFILGLSLLLQTYRLRRSRFVSWENDVLSWCLGIMKKPEAISLNEIASVTERPTALEILDRSGKTMVLSLSELSYADVQKIKLVLKDHLVS